MSNEYLAELPLGSLSNQHSVCVDIKEKSAAETSAVDSKSGCTYANSTKVERVENVSPFEGAFSLWRRQKGRDIA
jgi:hypothetical protein